MKKNNLYVLLFLLTIPNGQSLQELSKMKKEYEELKNSQSNFDKISNCVSIRIVGSLTYSPFVFSRLALP